MARKTLGHVQLEWTCPRCGGKNPGPLKTCTTCGGPQPADVKFEQVQGQELIEGEESQKIAEAAPDIYCAFCHTRNPADAAVCSQCGADLKEGTRREAGQVLGAYASEPVQQVACPHCGQPNPATAQRCANCGGSLTDKPVQQPAAPAAPPRKMGTGMLVGIILGGLALVVLCIILATTLGRSEDVVGTVSNASWMSSVAIEAYQPVTREDWRDEIPAGVEIGSCDYRYARTSDQPEPMATEVCGTPYTVDQGTGFGEVVQDCTYEVYEEYCEYTTSDWVQLDVYRLEGNDLNPQIAEPALQANQRYGEREAVYTIVFQTDQGVVVFTTTDVALFQRAQTGSRWVLTLDAFGNVRGIEPSP